jgi:EpsI family protein
MRSTLVRSLVVLAVMLASTGVASWLKPMHVVAKTSPTLKLEAIVPTVFADWTIDPDEFPIPLPPELQAVLDRTYDQILERTYVDAHGRRVMLSMDYTGHSEKGILSHRPEVCYPAQGFTVIQDSRPVLLQTPVGAIDATHLVARRGHRIEPITYWVIVEGEQTRFGAHMRWLQVRNGLAGVIPDGLLIRVSTIAPDPGAAFELQARFVSDLLANVAPVNRAHLIGSIPPAAVTSAVRSR